MADDANSANANEPADDENSAKEDEPAAPVYWAEVNEPSWQPQFTEQKIGALLRLTGDCPRCHHPTAMDFPAVIPSESLKAEGEMVTMYCKSGHPHEGHPEGDFSCGAYWATVAEL
jgi:hypothetical protein